jgi:hypothetical protein
MGTRNLTMVIQKEETKIAQYGQWDGYPSGNGVKILTFLRNKKRVEKLRKKLNVVRFSTADDEKKVDKFLKSIGSKDGWMTMDQSAKYQQEFPFLTRDLGAGILEAVANSKAKEIVLTDSTDFAGDSLFCEWAYVVDLDKNILECYSGFNKEPLAEGERFAKIPKCKDDSDYSAIRLLKKYDLNELPTKKEFVKELEKIAEEAYVE